MAGVVRVSRAPGVLDVMGGIAEYTGSMVCAMTMERATAIAIAPRIDRELRVFSDHQDQRIGLDVLAGYSVADFHKEFSEPDRRWAGLVAGCLYVLHTEGLIDLRTQGLVGMDLAIESTVPIGAGVSSSASIIVATMMNLRDHFKIAGKSDALKLAALCQKAKELVLGAPRGIASLLVSCAGGAGSLLKVHSQPEIMYEELRLPEGVRLIGIDIGVRRAEGDEQFARTRSAAARGHAMILEKMGEMGRAAGMRMVGDPTAGYLANLELDDYKKYFRSFLPEAVQLATDHHVHESQRIKNFAKFMEQAAGMEPHSAARSAVLDKAGHLMYASHVAYTRDALLGVPEADLLVDLVRKNERAGLYGAKITASGQGGTVAVLANETESADGAIGQIVEMYERQTGKTAEIFWGSSVGASEFGTLLVSL
jgi:galactokinase